MYILQSIKWLFIWFPLTFQYVVKVSALIVPSIEPNKNAYDIYNNHFKNDVGPSPPEFYISPPEHNPNLSKTPNYSPFLDLKGKYCETRVGTQCCPDRRDDCSVPVLGTLCYCDQFCDRAKNKKVSYANPDCCPDFYSVCRGPGKIVLPITTSTTQKTPLLSTTSLPYTTPGPTVTGSWSTCSVTCGLGREEQVVIFPNRTSFKQTRPCLLTNCPGSIGTPSPSPPEGCGGLFHGSSGRISYPGSIGYNYNNNANCRWIIATAPHTAIQFNFTRFHTQKNHDSLTIREHSTSSFPTNISGVMKGIVTTTSNIVTLIFISDGSITYTGFVVEWKELDVSTLSTNKGGKTIDVDIWVCKDSWGSPSCIQDAVGPVCNCQEAKALGWCQTGKHGTIEVCQATCDELCVRPKSKAGLVKDRLIKKSQDQKQHEKKHHRKGM